ncbi:MAG: hypothetical protein Fur0041_05230 [Bacteroidia bacterium]
MRSLRILGLGAILSVFAFSCKPEPVFPDEPILTFKEYIQNDVSDTLKVVFSFTDGDGDIGVSPTANDSNMVLVLYYKAPDGNFYVIDDPNTANPSDSVFYTYRIPKLASGQKGLEGDIYLTMNKAFIPYDTLQFTAFLLDQSDHKSNVVRTPEVELLR